MEETLDAETLYVIECIGVDDPKALKDALEDGEALGKIFGDRADELADAILEAHDLARKRMKALAETPTETRTERLMMNAYELYDAIFDTANDGAVNTVDYIMQYAECAYQLPMHIAVETAQKIVDCRKAWEAEENKCSDVFYHTVRKPLEEIEDIDTE